MNLHFTEVQQAEVLTG